MANRKKVNGKFGCLILFVLCVLSTALWPDNEDVAKPEDEVISVKKPTVDKKPPAFERRSSETTVEIAAEAEVPEKVELPEVERQHTMLVAQPVVFEEPEEPKASAEVIATLIPTPSRKWTNQAGTTILGMVTNVDLKSDTVSFRTADAREFDNYPISQLSEIDQTYIRGAAEGNLYGRVVGVHDGDSLTLLVGGSTQVKIRLEAIDAPELGQEYSNSSKQGLSSMVIGREVKVQVTGKDKYKRTLGFVFLGESNVNHEMIVKGLAWHFIEYSDDKDLAAAEKKARESGVGLWAGFNPMSPWDYRDRKREAATIANTFDPTPLPAVTTPSVKPTVKSQPRPKATANYWLNTSSNKRHNQGCRWYRNTKRGRSCSASEGSACGICGG